MVLTERCLWMCRKTVKLLSTYKKESQITGDLQCFDHLLGARRAQKLVKIHKLHLCFPRFEVRREPTDTNWVNFINSIFENFNLWALSNWIFLGSSRSRVATLSVRQAEKLPQKTWQTQKCVQKRAGLEKFKLLFSNNRPF